MPPKTQPAFRFMQINYRYGLLDEMGSIVGDALDQVLSEHGMDMEDVLNRLDGAGDETVERLNGLVEKWGSLFFRLAANEPMTRLQAYLLDKPSVRKAAVRLVKGVLAKRLAPIPGGHGLGPAAAAGGGPGARPEASPDESPTVKGPPSTDLCDYRDDMMSCVRCSSCKWVPFNQIKSARFAKNCPSVCMYNFHSYSGSGRLNMGLSILEERSPLNEKVSDILYRCQMCGACDTHCKVYREVIDINDVLLELRSRCVEEGELVIEHMAVMDALKRENNMVGEPKSGRGEWAEGLGLKDINEEKAEVLFHAGCRFCFDEELRDAVRSAVGLLTAAGLDVGIAGAEESCCGGRAYELGYRGEARNYFQDMLARVKASGARMVVTPCSDGYAAFVNLYPVNGVELPVEVLHTTQLLERLVAAGRLRPEREVGLRVTYHDPCHLGRMGEPYSGEWKGDKRLRLRSESRTGKHGVYDAPRNLLRAIPGLELVEMERIREYSWCCGAGGGVIDAFPEYALRTAAERLEEAESTGADVLVTACPWCERVFLDAAEETGSRMRVADLNALLAESCGLREPVRPGEQPERPEKRPGGPGGGDRP